MKKKKTKIGIIYGTRPEIIKLIPVIRELEKKKVPFFTIHTGQHYSYEMDKVFFKELDLKKPDYRLDIFSKGNISQNEYTAKLLTEIEKILIKEKPWIVIVHGDTNSTLAGALTAEKLSTTRNTTGLYIEIAHIEAGLRSYDRMMPEEVNRIVVDNLSDILFVPTEKEKFTLIKEGISNKRILVVGNTIADMVLQSVKKAKKESKILKELQLKKDKYILTTIHRQENVDEEKVLKDIFNGFEKVSKKTKLPIVWPIHPRTRKMIEKFKIDIPEHIKIIKSLGYLDFLNLEVNAKIIMTDSGGVQEEACILQVPCITLRENTERPETVNIGANLIVGTNPKKIINGVMKMLKEKNNWGNPFGDGKTSEKIVRKLLKVKKLKVKVKFL